MAKDAVKCPECGVEEVVKDGGPPVPLHEVGRFTCDACGTQFVFGKRVQRFVVEPKHDEKGVRWVRVRLQHPVTKADEHVFDLDPATALSFSKNLLSLL